MSAIAGIIAKQQQAVSLDAVLPHLTMYGDAQPHIWSSNQAALAYVHRSLTYQSHDERQPLRRGNFIIVADARIDNRGDLSRQLKDTGCADSALILSAYERWGTNCVQQLIGDYAFAIWDISAQQLFCARDHIGVRPFYYFDSPAIFAFASDLSALIAFDEVPDIIDEQSVQEYLYHSLYNLYSRQYTFFKNIYKLPYAHYLKLDRNNCVTRKYWTPEDVPPVRFKDEADYVAALSGLLEEAVRCRIQTPYDIGAHFSGGFDSSSVAVLAARQLREQNRTVAVFPWSRPIEAELEPDSELHRIAAICEVEQLHPQYVVAKRGYAYGFDLATWPYYTLKMARLVEQAAQKQGIRLMLSGWGGDEAVSFNGRGFAAGLFQQGKWHQLYRNFRPKKTMSRRKRVRYWMRIMGMKVFSHYLPPRLQQRLLPWESLRPPQDRFVAHEQRLSTVKSREKLWPTGWHARSIMFFLFQMGHVAGRMESWHWSGSEHSISYAYPLTDRRVMAFAYGIPIEMHLKNGWGRYLFRKVADGLFPNAIAWGRMGLLKDDPTFNAMGLHDTEPPPYDSQLKAFLDRNRDVPWLVVDRLERALQHGGIQQNADRQAVFRALMLLGIWEHWKRRQDMLETSTDG